MEPNKLLIKNLPPEFSEDDKTEFLKLFGGDDVVVMNDYGKLANCCYISFPDLVTTKQALHALHQFEILGRKLVAEYAKPRHSEIANELQCRNILKRRIETNAESSEEKGSKEKEKDVRQASVCPKLQVNHPFPSDLVYKYPDANIAILTNIANAMATVPKFYTQVLHLMNKMNLPPPFGGPTDSPPIGDTMPKQDACVDTSDLHNFASSDESELESDTERQHDIYRNSNSAEPLRKRKRLKAMNKISQEKLNIFKIKKPETVDNAFEVASAANRMEFRLANSIKEAVGKKAQPVVRFNVFDERGEFGKIDPVQRSEVKDIETKAIPVSEEVPISNEEKYQIVSDDEGTCEYIQAKTLLENRIPESEIVSMAQFKNYSRGIRTNRLYIKNLAKQVTETDLSFIFNRFLRKCKVEENLSLEIRLMQEGRMKGQAFITFPSEDIAEEALTSVHGYVLHDKPMVIQYGRGGK